MERGDVTAAERARLLQRFGIDERALIGAGGESQVYALPGGRVLRVARAGAHGGADPERLKAFLERIAGRLPFATPVLEEIAPDGSWRIERRLPGEAMSAAAAQARRRPPRRGVPQLRRGRGRARRRNPARPPLRSRARRFAGDGGRLADLRGAQPCPLRRAQPHHHPARGRRPAGALRARRRDDCGPAAQAAEGARPRRLFSRQRAARARPLGFGAGGFRIYTAVGDPQLDLAVATLTLEQIGETTAHDARFVRELIVERHGEGVAPALRFYRAYLAFSMADPANAAPPYPRLYRWSIAMLRLLAAGQLPP